MAGVTELEVIRFFFERKGQRKRRDASTLDSLSPGVRRRLRLRKIERRAEVDQYERSIESPTAAEVSSAAVLNSPRIIARYPP